MNKNLLGAFVLAGTLLVGGVANAANWNGLANYPEVPNSANGTETYFFDKASEFKGIDSSRNYVFGINVINMHNNQYGEATLFKYLVHPSLHTVYGGFSMSKSEFAQAYTERMFPDIAAPAGYIDPEFEVLFDNFAFDEVITEEGRNVPAKDRFLAILATLVGASAVDEYALMLPAALNFGLIPDEVVELIYQAVPYLGIGRVRPFFKVTNKIFDYRGETITDPSRSTITGESRLEKGVEKQVEIFGEAVRNSYQEGPEDTRHIKKWLANMFGDYYTRKGLSIAHREMITFCFLSAQGGCEPQLKAHVEGNLNVGNSKQYLINIASQCVPYIGYPRTLNALRCIQDGYTAWEAKQ